MLHPSVSGARETHYADEENSDDDNEVTILGVRDLSLFPSSVFGARETVYGDNEDSDDDDGDGVHISGLRDLSLLSHSTLGASQANSDDTRMTRVRGHGVLIPGKRDLSLFSSSISGAREAPYETEDDNNDDYSGRVLILGCPFARTQLPTMATSSSTSEENLSSFSSTTTTPSPRNNEPWGISASTSSTCENFVAR